jgi:hypothetical protein
MEKGGYLCFRNTRLPQLLTDYRDSGRRGPVAGSVMVFAEPINTHGHCPQGNSVSSLLGPDVLPVLSTALTTNVFTHSGRA